MLSTLVSLELDMGISPGDPREALLTQLLTAADKSIKKYCKQAFELQVNATEFRNGTGIDSLWLRQRPVYAFPITGTTVAGSATVTNLTPVYPLPSGWTIATLATLAPNMPVQAPSLAGFTTLVSTTSSTATLSANATKSGTGTIIFGLDLYMDAGAFFADGTVPVNPPGPMLGAFSYLDRLFLGSDFTLERDMPDGTSSGGYLKRLGGGLVGQALDWPGDWRKGTLTARIPPFWPRGIGNILISYVSGYLPTQIPADLSESVNRMAILLYRSRKWGDLIPQSESLADYSYSLMVWSKIPSMIDLRRMLSVYKEVVI